MTWALRLIDDFADDIMAARDEYLMLFRRSSVRRDGRSERGEASRRLIAVLDDYRANKRPLPRTTVAFRGRGKDRAVKPEQVNVSHLARQADCHRGLVLADLAQEYIDDWIAGATSQRRYLIRYFLKWTTSRRLTRELTVPSIPSQEPQNLLDEDDRWPLLQRSCGRSSRESTQALGGSSRAWSRASRSRRTACPSQPARHPGSHRPQRGTGRPRR